MAGHKSAVPGIPAELSKKRFLDDISFTPAWNDAGVKLIDSMKECVKLWQTWLPNFIWWEN